MGRCLDRICRAWAVAWLPALLLHCGVLTLVLAGTDVVAQAKGDAAPAPVTFADVLANPGDVGLNFRFARQQVEAGDLTGAAVTLERILIAQPQLQDIRLFDAVVLYRLDDYLEAEAELERIPTEGLPEKLKAEVDKYLALIERRRRTTRFYAITGIGVQYDSNVTAAPSSERVSVLNVQFPVDGAEDDMGYSARATFGLSRDMGTQIESDFIAEVTFFTREQANEDSQSTKLAFAKVGTEHHFGWGDLEPSLGLGWLELSHQTFYHALGPRLAAKRRLNKNFLVRGETSFTHEKFKGIAESRRAPDRTGNRFQYGVGIDYTLSAKNLLRVTSTYTKKNAKETFEEFDGVRIGATLTTLLFGDHFLQSGVAVGFRTYDVPDPFFSSRTRRDEFIQLRFAYGLPFSAITRRLTGAEPSDFFKDVLVVPSLEFYRQNSNITNFDYDNARVMLTLTKRFDF